MHTPVPLITVDGPGGSGKGTISLLLARELGWHFLDSGAIYRALALRALKKSVDLDDTAGLVGLAKNLPVTFDEFQVCLEGEDVTQAMRSERCGSSASKIAVFPAVREALLARQRDFLQLPGLVADGRDMGTVVFPQAPIKLYLEASLAERAKRRYLQLKDTEKSVTLDEILHEIAERDKRDKNRVFAPLSPARDATIIDTTGMSISSVFSAVMQIVKQRMSLQSE
jgi:cytidylate kinase